MILNIKQLNQDLRSFQDGGHYESEEVEFDIFSQEGYYLYKTKIPFTPEVIKNGYFYDHYSSEETGEVKIKRYKVKNWGGDSRGNINP